MINRIPPQMNVTAYKSYHIQAPLTSHWRPATCEEVDCPNYLNGWVTTVDESTELGTKQAHYIRHDKSRSCKEQKLPNGLTEFMFIPGQRCFTSDHRKRLEREEFFIERDGDFRGNPSGRRIVHTSPGAWMDSFGEHQETLSDKFNQG